MSDTYAPEWVKEKFKNPVKKTKGGHLDVKKTFTPGTGNAFKNTDKDYNSAKQQYGETSSAMANLDRVVLNGTKPTGVNNDKVHNSDPWTGTTKTSGVAVREYYLDNEKLRVMKRTERGKSTFFLAEHSGAFNGFNYYFLTNIPVSTVQVVTTSNSNTSTLPSHDTSGGDVEVNTPALTGTQELRSSGGGSSPVVFRMPEHKVKENWDDDSEE